MYLENDSFFYDTVYDTCLQFDVKMGKYLQIKWLDCLVFKKEIFTKVQNKPISMVWFKSMFLLDANISNQISN